MKNQRKADGKGRKSFLRSIGVALLLLLLVSLPLYSQSSSFLDQIELEITLLENNWMDLNQILIRQGPQLESLETSTKLLLTQQQLSETRLVSLETEIETLSKYPKMLEKEFNVLNDSLKQSEKEIRKLKFKNSLLATGLLAVSAVAVYGLIQSIL